MKSLNKGIWISIEGTEGVGKSTLAKHLASLFENSIIAPEFSNSHIGEFLKNAVQQNPHIISESLIEQSLLFLADFFRIYDSIVVPHINNSYIVISDRGFVSKYVYQCLVLTSLYNHDTAREMLNALFRLIPGPDFVIYLTCEEDEQIRRLLCRDGHCDKARMDFIRNANKEFEEFLKKSNFKFSTVNQTCFTTLEDFTKDGENAIKQFLSNT